YRGKQLPGRPTDETFGRLEFAWSPAQPLPRLPCAWPGRVFWEANAIADNFLDRANDPHKHVAGRLLHGAGLELALPLPGVSITLEAKNLTDDRTSDAFSFPLPGRTLFATLSYGLGRREGDDAGR